MNTVGLDVKLQTYLAMQPPFFQGFSEFLRVLENFSEFLLGNSILELIN